MAEERSRGSGLPPPPATSSMLAVEFANIEPVTVCATSSKLAVEFANIAPATVSATSSMLAVELANIAPATVSATSSMLAVEFANIAPATVSATSAKLTWEFANIAPDTSSKAVRTLKRCVLYRFLVDVVYKDQLYHDYDVAISPKEITSKKVWSEIMYELVITNRTSHFGNKTSAYDGQKSFCRAGAMPFASNDFTVKLPDIIKKARVKKEGELKVPIKLAVKHDVHHLQKFLRGRILDAPHEAIQGKIEGELVRDLLIAYWKTTGLKPTIIIFYRDEVSEGQFSQVLQYEVDAIRKACLSLQENYLPQTIFVVVQCRHLTRLFTAQHGDHSSTDNSRNILPGTILNTKICHPSEFDFYLCSHAGIQGNSRPTHYHVLRDKNSYTAHGLQIPINYLCYTVKQERELKVRIKLSVKHDVHHLQEFLRGRILDAPHEAIQVLDVVLRATPSENNVVVGRSIFFPTLDQKGELGNGVEFWKGFYQSLRPTQMALSLNIDMAATAFYKYILVSDFVVKYSNIRDRNRLLSDQDQIKIQRALKGLRVQLIHREDGKQHKTAALSRQPMNQLRFARDESSEQTTVVAQDRTEITKYRALVCAQGLRDEIISDLYKVTQDPQKGKFEGGMVRELLIAYWKTTGLNPVRIIFYGDGVIEGQFSQVLLHEVDATRKACLSLKENYLPQTTFVVVQCRHLIRLFAAQHGDHNSTDNSRNILPGPILNTKICHPSEFDFYLCSHAGIQGNSRPTHYHVLRDNDNEDQNNDNEDQNNDNEDQNNDNEDRNNDNEDRNNDNEDRNNDNDDLNNDDLSNEEENDPIWDDPIWKIPLYLDSDTDSVYYTLITKMSIARLHSFEDLGRALHTEWARYNGKEENLDNPNVFDSWPDFHISFQDYFHQPLGTNTNWETFKLNLNWVIIALEYENFFTLKVFEGEPTTSKVSLCIICDASYVVDLNSYEELGNLLHYYWSRSVQEARHLQNPDPRESWPGYMVRFQSGSKEIDIDDDEMDWGYFCQQILDFYFWPVQEV